MTTYPRRFLEIRPYLVINLNQIVFFMLTKDGGQDVLKIVLSTDTVNSDCGEIELRGEQAVERYHSLMRLVAPLSSRSGRTPRRTSQAAIREDN